MPQALLERLQVDQWDRMIDVNIKGVLYGIAAALPYMQRQKAGHFINVSSVAGHRVGPGSVVYSATKHAVRVISEGLRQEVKPYNIRTTIISPGAVATELPDSVTDPEAAARIRKSTRSPQFPPIRSRVWSPSRSASRKKWTSTRFCSVRPVRKFDQVGSQKMPHVIIKLQSGRSDTQKARIAEEVTRTVMATANCAEEAVSVSIEDVEPRDWVEKVYKPDIAGKAGTLFKKPGYQPA